MPARIRTIGTEDIKNSPYPLIIGYFGCIHVMHEQLFAKHHPFNVLTFSDFGAKLETQIYRLNERIDNIAKFGPDNIYVFDIAKHNVTAQQFVDEVLKKINPNRIVVGGDFKFGSDHQNIEFLKRFFPVDVVPYNKNVSTTNIYNLLINKQLDEANSLMYFPYYYVSKWVGGEKRGRKIGIRTINSLIDHKLILPEGSYVTKITLGNKTYHSVSFFGKSKTFGFTHPVLETHVLNRIIPPRFVIPSRIKNSVKVEFLKFIRSNGSFALKDELATAIKNDIQFAKDYFVHNK